jgi:hypothetical protein
MVSRSATGCLLRLGFFLQAQPSRHNKGQEEKGSVSKVKSQTQKRDDLICYSGNQLDASNPERKRGKKREVPKKKKKSVLKSAVLEERALRRRQALQEQSESVDVQKEGDGTVDSSTCVSDTVLSGAEEIQGCVCVTESGEVTDDNGRKDEDVNITEVLNLTESLKENLSLNTICKATALSEDVSDGPECAEEMMRTVERGEGDCTDIPSGLLPHGFSEDLRRLSVHSRRFRE